MKQVWKGCEVSKYQGYSQHKIKTGVRDKKGGAQSKTSNKCGKGARLVIMEVYELKTKVQRFRKGGAQR